MHTYMMMMVIDGMSTVISDNPRSVFGFVDGIAD